jgi:death on curing protein
MTDIRQPWTQWIGTDTIAKLYSENMTRWGGKRSDPEKGCIDAALGSAYSAELYRLEEEPQDGIIPGLIFACYLLFYIATKHCYVDGNKRLGWTSAMFVLLNFGLTVEATEDEAVEFCVSIASGQVKDGTVVVGWITDRLSSVI